LVETIWQRCHAVLLVILCPLLEEAENALTVTPLFVVGPIGLIALDTTCIAHSILAKLPRREFAIVD
jgi:hypothetical protein